MFNSLWGMGLITDRVNQLLRDLCLKAVVRVVSLRLHSFLLACRLSFAVSGVSNETSPKVRGLRNDSGAAADSDPIAHTPSLPSVTRPLILAAETAGVAALCILTAEFMCV